LSHFNSIDFLVNCAGIIRRTSFLEIGTEEWDLVFGINIRGQFLFCRTVLAHMKERNRGVIVNVASLAGRTCSLLGGAHYTSAKHALIGLSRHLALEYAPLGIRVNAFCPGATVTPLVFNSTSKEEISRLEASIPRRKCASAQEQANIIAFLISDASANIVGACIDSNGGSLMI
jgi:3-oxoacyl-[acyl-carrier protein] reductase